MTEIEENIACRRVRFTYNSLLYKLDNIHLKQTHHGKPFRRKSNIPNGQLEYPDVSNEHPVSLENSKKINDGSDSIHNQSNDKLVNGYGTDRTSLNLSESDIDDHSDLSIDGGNVNDNLPETESWLPTSVTDKTFDGETCNSIDQNEEIRESIDKNDSSLTLHSLELSSTTSSGSLSDLVVGKESVDQQIQANNETVAEENLFKSNDKFDTSSYQIPIGWKVKLDSQIEISNESNKQGTSDDTISILKTDDEKKKVQTEEFRVDTSSQHNSKLKQPFSSTFKLVQSHKRHNVNNMAKSHRPNTSQFVKEFDNSLCLINDLLNIGSSRRDSTMFCSTPLTKQSERSSSHISILPDKNDEDFVESVQNADSSFVKKSVPKQKSQFESYSNFITEKSTLEPKNIKNEREQWELSHDTPMLSTHINQQKKNNVDSTHCGQLFLEDVSPEHRVVFEEGIEDSIQNVTYRSPESRKIFSTSYPPKHHKTQSKKEEKFTNSLNEKAPSDFSILVSSKVFKHTDENKPIYCKNRDSTGTTGINNRKPMLSIESKHTEKHQESTIENTNENTDTCQQSKLDERKDCVEILTDSTLDTERKMTDNVQGTTTRECDIGNVKSEEPLISDRFKHTEIIPDLTIKKTETESKIHLGWKEKKSVGDVTKLHELMLRDESKHKPKFRDMNMSNADKRLEITGHIENEISEEFMIATKGKNTDTLQNQTGGKIDNKAEKCLGLTTEEIGKHPRTHNELPIENKGKHIKQSQYEAFFKKDKEKQQHDTTKENASGIEIVKGVTQNNEGELTETPKVIMKNDKDKYRLHKSTIEDQEMPKEKRTESMTNENGSGPKDGIPITIKRLTRPGKLKQTRHESSSYPFNSFPMMYSGFDYKYKDSEYPTPKMIAETVANLPAMMGFDSNLQCPQCGEKDFNTGETETSCTDLVHKMLLKIPSLQTIAAQNGLVVRNIAGDGNCMFSAVIDQLKIVGDFRFTQHSLRSTAVQYLREHPLQEDGSHLESFLATESWEEYLKRMNREGEWGDHMILNCITEVIDYYVTVLSSSGSVTQLSPKHMSMSDDGAKESIYLGHVGGTHYVSLRPKDWEETWPINAKLRRLRYYSNRQNTTCLESNGNDETGQGKEKIGSEPADDIFLDDIFKGNFTNRRLGITKSIATDILFVDPISRIPTIHLSFILRLLLHIQDFCMKYASSFQLPEDSELEIESIGTTHEGMNVTLRNYSKSSYYKTTDHLSIKQIVFPPSSKYNVITYNPSLLDVSHSHGVLPIVVDTAGIHSGYCRLRALGCTQCQRLLGISKYVNGVWYVSDLQLRLTLKDDVTKKLQYLTGVRCPLWPDQAREWIFRERSTQWPKKDIIDKIKTKGCYIAHRSHPESDDKDIEFQFLFSEAEGILNKEALTEDMKYCFYVFKSLVEFQMKDIECQLTTYFLKTALFFSCESVPTETWRNSCGGCLLYLVDLLLQWLREHNLPNYFIRQNNMIDHWTKGEVDILCERIETLRLFPCMVLHFLSEKNGITHHWLIDSVMASSKKFKSDYDIFSLIEDTLNPTTFCFAGYNVSHRRDYEYALELLNEAFEHNLILLSGASIDFQEFIDKFLLTINGKKTRMAFQDFIGEKLHLNQTTSKTKNSSTREVTEVRQKYSCTLDGLDVKSKTYGEFLGPNYNGKYRAAQLPSNGNIWKGINKFLSSLLFQLEYEEIIELGRCLISKCQLEVKKSNSADVMKYTELAFSYYDLLYICYTSINQPERMSDIIDDYQELVEKFPSKWDLANLASIWKELGNLEKAKNIEDNMNDFADDVEDKENMKHLFAIYFR